MSMVGIRVFISTTYYGDDFFEYHIFKPLISLPVGTVEVQIPSHTLS